MAGWASALVTSSAFPYSAGCPPTRSLALHGRLGEYPFTAHNQAALIMRILRGGYEPPPACYPPALRDGVVGACLQADPAARPTAAIRALHRPSPRTAASASAA